MSALRPGAPAPVRGAVRRPSRWSGLCLSTLSACLPQTETGDSAVQPDPATVPLAGACPMETDFGGFAVTRGETESSVSGAVADGVVPTAVLTEVAREGECEVMRRENPFCDPGCEPGETCDLEGACVPYPTNRDLGTVEVGGLSEPVQMTAVFPGNTYYDTDLPHPAFEPGGLVTLDMPAGAYGPATLHGVGVEPLEGVGKWTLGEGLDLAVTWAPPGAGARSEIVLKAAIDQHGVTPGVLRCTFADSGTATVPASVVSALVSAGVTGFPSGTLERRTADRTDAGAGCMDFVVSAPRTVEVTVAGHTPCVTDEECPEEQSCDEELQTCG